jgi:hypothetical protein
LAWWKKALLVVFSILAWTVGLLIVGGWGYSGQYFWSSLCVAAVGFAVAPFWRLRGSIWYWPTVALLILINLAAMYLNRDFVAVGDLPSKGAVQGLLLLDCMACWALMVGIAYLFDRKFPWNR